MGANIRIGGRKGGGLPVGGVLAFPGHMTQKERDLLYSYIYHNYNELESEIITLKNNLRFRHIDVCDCMEYIVALQRFDTFKEVTQHIRELLNLDKNNDKG